MKLDLAASLFIITASITDKQQVIKSFMYHMCWILRLVRRNCSDYKLWSSTVTDCVGRLMLKHGVLYGKAAVSSAIKHPALTASTHKK